MSEIKPSDVVADAAQDAGEEKDWAAAKAFFDSLKTKKPRPVSRLCGYLNRDDALGVIMLLLLAVLLVYYNCAKVTISNPVVLLLPLVSQNRGMR